MRAESGRLWSVMRIGAADLVTIRPAKGTGRAAVRAGTTVLGALLVLLATGHLPWAAYACFAALATIYGGPVAGRRRTRMQAGVALVLVGCIVIGAAVGVLAARAWVAVPVIAIIAGAAAALSDRFRWRPPGPIFPVLMAATCASIPTKPADLGWAALVAATTAAVGVGIGALEAMLPIRRLPAPPPLFPSDPTPSRRRMHWIRCVVVVLVAGSCATAIGIGHPYWAMVTAVVPLSVMRVRAQIVRGAQRTTGTVLGLGVAAVALALPLPPIAVVLLIACLQAVSEMLVPRNYAAALVLITPLALLSAHLAAPQPTSQVLVDRLIETVLGSAIGIAAAIVTRERAAT